MKPLKRGVVMIGAGLVIISGGLVSAGNSGRNGNGMGPPVSDVSCDQVLDEYFESLPETALDFGTEDDIILLREEEKMARDFYLEMSGLYDLSIFPNIAGSEQHHMDLVAKLLARYGLVDNAAGNFIGEFENDWVQETYDDLLVFGSQSLINGLLSGATIEDVDIWHLDHLIDYCEDHDFDDVCLIVQNMNAGSRNHMRSFAAALSKHGVTYEPQWISQDRLEEILNSEMETAVILDEDGEVLAECGVAGGSIR